VTATAVVLHEAGVSDLEALSDPSAAEMVVQVAHDLRSPLSSILVLAESLQAGRTGPVSEAQRQQLTLIYDAALALCGTANDLMQMAGAGTGLPGERPVSFSVREVLHSVRDIVGPILEGKRLDLRIVSPAFDQRRGHARLLARVLLNLTTNAIRSTESGHVQIAVREMAGDSRRVHCSVRDTGCGLEPAVLRSIFGSLGDARNTLREQLSSSGLGLRVCRRLVRAMGSTLHVESRSRVGTTFSFELGLPLAALDA
jgi:signal transduction histidine kinase